MSKLIVSASSMEHLYELLDMNINGVILSIDKLSVNDSFYIGVDEIDKIDFKEKEVFVSLNKLMHNSDLEYLMEVMHKLKTKDVKIMFYDMAVYNIAKEYDMINKLVIMQDHLNASILSNKFYYNRGITGSFITSDITKDELMEIKENSQMKIFFMVYGYAPIFYSRRYLVSNYLKFIDKNNDGNNYKILSDNGISYPINEEEYGTTIYTDRPINLINYLPELDNIDYLVMKSNMVDSSEFNKMVLNFLDHKKIDNAYIGFFMTKTIYKVK